MCILFHSICNLNVAQVNIQISLIWEHLGLTSLKLSHNVAEATKTFLV